MLYSQFHIYLTEHKIHVAGSCYKSQVWSTEYIPDWRHDHLWQTFLIYCVL